LETVVEFNRLLALESEGKALDGGVLRRGVAALLADSAKGRYFIAELGGQVVGQLMLTCEWSDWRDGWWWWLQSVYVRAEARPRPGALPAPPRPGRGGGPPRPGGAGPAAQRRADNPPRPPLLRAARLRGDPLPPLPALAAGLTAKAMGRGRRRRMGRGSSIRG